MAENINFNFVRKFALERVTEQLENQEFSADVISQVGKMMNEYVDAVGELDNKRLLQEKKSLLAAIDSMNIDTEEQS